jgi:2-oxo-hept-3-ene-1,7-dioate hydratase
VSVALSLDRPSIRAAAVALDQAERSRVQIPLLHALYPAMTMDDAYAIQTEWVQQKCTDGDAIIGYKIGLTSKAMQAALSIDIPDSGVLLRSMLFENGAEIAPNRFIQPRVEAEIAFIMKTPLSGKNLTGADILKATECIAPALEILDTRIVRKDPASGRLRTVMDTISDNAANAGIVLGKRCYDFHSIDLRWIGAIVARNGEVEETGLGAGVLNDPLLSVRWLADRLAAYGDRIEAGQILLSGSFIRPVEAPAGSHITADFGVFGEVSCRFG